MRGRQSVKLILSASLRNLVPYIQSKRRRCTKSSPILLMGGHVRGTVLFTQVHLLLFNQAFPRWYSPSHLRPIISSTVLSYGASPTGQTKHTRKVQTHTRKRYSLARLQPITSSVASDPLLFHFIVHTLELGWLKDGGKESESSFFPFSPVICLTLSPIALLS